MQLYISHTRNLAKLQPEWVLYFQTILVPTLPTKQSNKDKKHFKSTHSSNE